MSDPVSVDHLVHEIRQIYSLDSHQAEERIATYLQEQLGSLAASEKIHILDRLTAQFDVSVPVSAERVYPDDEVMTAAKLLLDNRINGIPVVGSTGSLVGILTQSDLVAQQKRLHIPSFFTFLDGLFSTSSLKQIEKEVLEIRVPLKVAVMGCVVNGPGEARDADVGIAGGKGKGVVFRKGKIIRSVREEDLLEALLAEIKEIISF